MRPAVEGDQADERSALSQSEWHNTVRTWSDHVRRALGLASFYVRVYGHQTLELTMFEVRRVERRHGIGSEAMRQLTAFADRYRQRVVLTPSTRDDLMGTTSRARLVRFYKRFGFYENKGRRKDFTVMTGMIREPRS